MIQQQQTMILSPYTGIYDLVVPKDNILRKIKELIDFSFIYDELLDRYCLDNGRNAINPIRMFKYLLLKAIFDLSDIDIVERSKYDMSFKYFLDMAPEDEVIESSSLTKFRKLRLKDMNLLDMLINKTVEIAIEKGIIKSKSIIVDATHIKARYNQKSPKEILMDRSKKLRKEDEFEFNKDAGMYVCKAGHMAIRKARQGKKGVAVNQTDAYYFDVEKCKSCPYKEGCYREGAKSKSYSVSIKSDEHNEQAEFQESDYFKKKSKERYKIEAKNSELKHRHGYDVASSSGLIGMELQGAMAIFTVNLKRILKLIG